MDQELGAEWARLEQTVQLPQQMLEKEKGNWIYKWHTVAMNTTGDCGAVLVSFAVREIDNARFKQQTPLILFLTLLS